MASEPTCQQIWIFLDPVAIANWLWIVPSRGQLMQVLALARHPQSWELLGHYSREVARSLKYLAAHSTQRQDSVAVLRSAVVFLLDCPV